MAPFPGLRQMAVFAVCGLTGAWLGVVLLLPAWAGRPPRVGLALRLTRWWLGHGPARIAQAYHARTLWVMGAAFVVFAACAITFLQPDDNMSVLYDSPSELQQTDAFAAQLLGAQEANRAIVIHGSSAAAVLQTELRLKQALRHPEAVA